MQLTFLGANHQVTGSRYCLEVAGRKIMIDCGMFQERDFLERNWAPCPIPASEFDAVLLTHVHIDHCGLLPRIVHEGFSNPVYATRPSVDLAEIMLRDSAHIQMEDAEYKRRRHQKQGHKGKYPVKPLYDVNDVEKTLPLLRSVEYGDSVAVNDAVTAVFHDAGHILGSSMIEIVAKENGQSRRLIFSGDIGQVDKPLVNDPTYFDEADYVVMESTYGIRDHGDDGDVTQRLAEIINATRERGGNTVIPVFAVERAQEMMYHISQLIHAGTVPEIPIYLDSPMAVEVTKIFRRSRDYFDEETLERLRLHDSPLDFPGLTLSRTTDESKAINRSTTPSVIMSASGMCSAGRIKHHLRYNIVRPESTILFVGYQGRGTLGRHILDGDSEVRIHGQVLPVKAKIEQIHGLSAHADRSGLIAWVSHFKKPPRHVFVAHGETEASENLVKIIQTNLGWSASSPEYHAEETLN